MYHIFKVCFLFFLLRSTLGNECTDLRFLENRFACLKSEPGYFPVKGNCEVFIKCVQPGTTEQLSILECPAGTMFNGTLCVEADASLDLHNCPQRRCFPRESKTKDELEREYESSLAAIQSSYTKETLVSSSRESKYLPFGRSGATASSSLISFSKIVISFFLIDFIFVICIM